MTVCEFQTRIKTRQLALAVALADRGSMLKASQAINLSQPACSKLLHELEMVAGAALFTRHARGMTLTGEGEVFVTHARAALREINGAGAAVAALRSGLTGSVTIGTEATSATALVPRAVALMKARYPFVTVSVELAFSETLIRDVRTGRLELAIARLGSRSEEVELETELLEQSSHVLAVRQGHPLLSGGRPSWPDLLEFGWILPPSGNVMRTSLALFLQQRGLDLPAKVIVTAALPVTISLLRLTEFIAPLPLELVRDHANRGVLAELPVRMGLKLQPASLVWRRAELPPAARALLHALRESFQVRMSSE
jgi:DNA-binding transcriptional LysR family regulator